MLKQILEQTIQYLKTRGIRQNTLVQAALG